VPCYTFKLSDGTNYLFVILTSFELFQYEVAPMGIKQSPDFAQEIIVDAFHDLDDVKVYIDNILVYGCTTMRTLKNFKVRNHKMMVWPSIL
jgi:hypothetical protein